MKVQQNRHEADVMSSRGGKECVYVCQNGVIDAKRITLAIESNARACVAKKKNTHGGHTIARDRRECLIEPIQRGRLAAESAIREPEAGADVGAIPYPWEIDADDESIRITD
jgi:hypothetical protein